MLSRDGARLQLFLELRRRCGLRRGPEELVIIDERVIERAWGWVFPYTTRGWRNGDSSYAIGGNGPCAVNRFDGSFTFFPTAIPFEEALARFEAWLLLEPENRDENVDWYQR